MGLVVEDGTGVAEANAYVTMDEAVTYTADRGLAFVDSPSAAGEAAIIRATTSLDAKYRGRFAGSRTNGRDQGLEFPRTGLTDLDGVVIDDDEIPIEIKRATIELAVREFASPGSTLPDLERGGGVKRLKAGSVEIEYGSNASNQTTLQLIDGILGSLFFTQSNSVAGESVRG